MAGKMVPAVFGDVPNLEIVPVLFEITGSFTHEPNPLVESNLDLLKQKIGREKPAIWASALTGMPIAACFVDENRKTIGCDMITALLARDFLADAGEQGSDDCLRFAIEPCRSPTR